jgi:hypothetical protein
MSIKMSEQDLITTVDSRQEVISRVTDALNLQISARHASKGLIDLNGALNDENLPLEIRRLLDLEIRFSISRSIEPLRTNFYLKQELEDPAFQTLTAGLLLGGQVLQSQFKSYLRNAIAITHAYLIRPESTLLSLLTSGETQAHLDKRFFEILDRIVAYGHLADVTKAWAERQRAEGIEAITEDELAGLMRRIERNVIGNYGVEEMALLLQPLYDFYWISALDQIPSPILEEFFDDRGMTKVRNAISDRPLTHYSLSAIIGLLHELIGDVPNAPKSSVLEVQPTQAQTITESSLSGSPNYDDFIHELRDAGIAVLPPTRSTKAPVQKEFTISADRSYETHKTYEDLSTDLTKATVSEDKTGGLNLSAKPEAGAPSPLQQLISLKARKRFIEKLFNENEKDYERFLSLINQSENWKQASVYVDAIFLRHKINPYSKHAVRFTDIVYSRYLKRN